MMPQFVHLHVHSHYSILDGQASIPRLVDKAMADGQPGIALTDHGNMFGVKEFFNYVKKQNGKKHDKLKELKRLLNAMEELLSKEPDPLAYLSRIEAEVAPLKHKVEQDEALPEEAEAYTKTKSRIDDVRQMQQEFLTLSLSSVARSMWRVVAWSSKRVSRIRAVIT